MADNVDWDAVKRAMQDPEVAKVFQQAQEDPAVAQYLRDEQAKAQAAAVGGAAAPTASPATAPAAPALDPGLADPAFQEAIKNPEVAATFQQATQNPDVANYLKSQQAVAAAPNTVDVQLSDISIKGGSTVVQTPGGGSIRLPQGVSPGAQLHKNTAAPNPNDPFAGQFYVTGVGADGQTYHYYNNGAGGTQAIPANLDNGGFATATATSDSTGGAVAPASNSNPAGDTDGAAAPGAADPTNKVHIGTAVHTSSKNNGAVHTVKKGDTMWDIAQESGKSLGELIALNPQVKDPNLIRPGEKINLGTASASETGGAAFPSSSSYDTWSSNSGGQVAASGTDEGWGTDATVKDPATTPMQSMAQPSTDPLKIDDKK